MNKPVLGSLAMATCLSLSLSALAADVSTEPSVDLRVEQNDNLELDPETTPDSDVLGYIAEMDLLMGIATPRGETSLRPRVRFQDYPDREDFERVEGFLDMLSRYEWQRSTLSSLATFRTRTCTTPTRRVADLTRSTRAGEIRTAGPRSIGQTRTSLGLQPDVRAPGYGAHDALVSPRTISRRRYDADDGPSNRTDYDYGVLDGYFVLGAEPFERLSASAHMPRAMRPRTRSRPRTPSADDLAMPIAGRRPMGSRRPSITSATRRNRSCRFFSKRATSDFGGTLTAFRKLEVSEWRLSVGRYFIPTGDSGKSVSDRFRIQYDRLLSQRLSFRAPPAMTRAAA